nr:protein PIN-LIKES 6 [Ipomoea trifida]
MMDRIQRLLVEVLTESQGGGTSLLGSIKIAVLPIAKVFTMCFMGFLMASKWFIPVNVVMATISGSIIGLVVATIVRPPYPFFKFTIIQIGIGNIGNVPLVLIAALCRDKSNPFGDSNKCSQDGNAYISFGQWVGAIVLYTYVFHMLAPPPEGTFDIEDGHLPMKAPNRDSSHAAVPLLAEEPAVPVSTSSQKNKELAVNYFDYTSELIIRIHCLIFTQIKEFFKFLYEKLKLKQIIQPPIIASILAIFLGCVPFFKKLIFTSDAPLYFFTDSCMILGEAMIPCILLALGGNLVQGPGSSKLGLRTTAAIIFGRLVLVPPTGLGIVTLADKLGFLPAGDKMFRFVLLLQHTMPTSVLSGAVANLRGCGREAAAVLFWVHIFAVFSMAGWIILYLSILF